MDNKVEEFVENHARENEIQISDALKKLLKGASSLNYMNHKGKFKVTTRMLEDPNILMNYLPDVSKKPTKNPKMIR